MSQIDPTIFYYHFFMLITSFYILSLGLYLIGEINISKELIIEKVITTSLEFDSLQETSREYNTQTKLSNPTEVLPLYKKIIVLD